MQLLFETTKKNLFSSNDPKLSKKGHNSHKFQKCLQNNQLWTGIVVTKSAPYVNKWCEHIHKHKHTYREKTDDELLQLIFYVSMTY